MITANIRHNEKCSGFVADFAPILPGIIIQALRDMGCVIDKSAVDVHVNQGNPLDVTNCDFCVMIQLFSSEDRVNRKDWLTSQIFEMVKKATPHSLVCGLRLKLAPGQSYVGMGSAPDDSAA